MAFVPLVECESPSAFGLRTADEILARHLADEGMEIPPGILSGIQRLNSQLDAAGEPFSTTAAGAVLASSR